MKILLSLFYYLTSQTPVQILEGMRRSIVNKNLSAFGSLAGVVAGLLCAVVMLKLAHDYLEGQGITLWQVLRPLVLLALCCNFNLFVAGPLHSVCNLVTRGMTNQCQMSAKNFFTKFGEQFVTQLKASQLAYQMEMDQAGEDLKNNVASVANGGGNTGENRGFWQKLGDGIGALWKSGVSYVVHRGNALLYNLDFAMGGVLLVALEAVLVLIMKAVVFGQQVSCYIVLTLLTLLGPFTFALSILPGFSRSISAWIARYIQVALWIPIGQLMMFINYQLLGRITELTAQYNFGAKYVFIVVLFVCIWNVSKVPQIATYVVESSGAAGVGASGGVIRETFQTVSSIKMMGLKG